MDDPGRWHFAACTGASFCYRIGWRGRAGPDYFPAAFMLGHTVSLDVRVTSSTGTRAASPGPFLLLGFTKYDSLVIISTYLSNLLLVFLCSSLYHRQ